MSNPLVSFAAGLQLGATLIRANLAEVCVITAPDLEYLCAAAKVVGCLETAAWKLVMAKTQVFTSIMFRRQASAGLTMMGKRVCELAGTHEPCDCGVMTCACNQGRELRFSAAVDFPYAGMPVWIDRRDGLVYSEQTIEELKRVKFVGFTSRPIPRGQVCAWKLDGTVHPFEVPAPCPAPAGEPEGF